MSKLSSRTTKTSFDDMSIQTSDTHSHAGLSLGVFRFDWMVIVSVAIKSRTSGLDWTGLDGLCVFTI